MEHDDVNERLTRMARQHYDAGDTSAFLYLRAEQMDRAGLGFASPHARLLASIVAQIEETEGRKRGA